MSVACSGDHEVEGVGVGGPGQLRQHRQQDVSRRNVRGHLEEIVRGS